MNEWTATPVYFIRQTLKTPRQLLKKGDAWDRQDKRDIRAWSEAFGVPDDGRPFSELPFVTTLVAPSAEAAAKMVSMTLDQARAYLKELQR